MAGEKLLNMEGLERTDRENPGCMGKPMDTAYIIYTSGSTGKPKGVQIPHRSAVRVVRDTNYITVVPDDRLLQLSNYAFDGSVFDIFGALLNGASLVLLPEGGEKDLEMITQTIRETGVTVLFCTTALFNAAVDLDVSSFAKVRKVLFGGEKVSVEHSRKALESLGAGKIIHVYGPTESTVFATYYPLDRLEAGAGTVPIGKPISNTKVYIIGKDGHLQPEGVAGEICIAGDGLAKGYLNAPELTEERFIEDTYCPGERMYRTGDLGRWLPDGNIEFIGRMDR